MEVKLIKNNMAFSFTLKGSDPCTINAATDMVIIVGTVAQRVLKPIITKIGHISSPMTARNREGVAPIPMGSPNSKLPPMSF